MLEGVWRTEAVLDDNFCDGLVQIASQQNFNEGAVRDNRIDPQVRSSSITGIDNPDLMATFLNFIDIANKESGWNFDINGLEPLQFSTYYPEDHYGWHIDIQKDYNPLQIRKLSLVVNLNQDYTGGQFQFSWGKPSKSYHKRIIEYPELKRKGSITVFPSFVWHRVKPIKSGQKHSLAAWAVGPAFR